jgi:hypothetical protein
MTTRLTEILEIKNNVLDFVPIYKKMKQVTANCSRHSNVLFFLLC